LFEDTYSKFSLILILQGDKSGMLKLWNVSLQHKSANRYVLARTQLRTLSCQTMYVHTYAYMCITQQNCLLWYDMIWKDINVYKVCVKECKN